MINTSQTTSGDGSYQNTTDNIWGKCYQAFSDSQQHTQRARNLATKLLTQYLPTRHDIIRKIFFYNCEASKVMPRLRTEFFRIKF